MGVGYQSMKQTDPVYELLSRVKTIAVVGLSDSPMRPSHGVSAYMQAQGYKIIPVNPQIAEALSQALGKTVNYIPVTLEQNEQAVRSRGLPDWLVTHLLLVARATATGGFSKVNVKPIVDIVGRDPITAKKFVEDFKAAFA